MGFSAIADEMDESSLTQIINHYLTEMSKIALEYGGTIDKFIGDAVMVFFGDPRTRGPKEDCLACVSMALAMRQRVIELQDQWRKLGLTRPLEIRMGISTGFCTVGNFGTESRLHYTLLGSEVNLASRLETSARPGEILVSHATWLFIQDQILCRDQGELEVKGFKHPIKVYSVVDHRKHLGAHHPCVDYRTEGSPVHGSRQDPQLRPQPGGRRVAGGVSGNPAATEPDAAHLLNYCRTRRPQGMAEPASELRQGLISMPPRRV